MSRPHGEPDRPPAEHGGVDDLPPEAWLLVLAGLHQMTPARLRSLCECASPRTVVEALQRGSGALWVRLRRRFGSSGPELLSRWQQVLHHLEPTQVWADHRRSGVTVSAVDDEAEWASLFGGDPARPVMLCWKGSIACARRRRVAVVGTRSCTRYGSDVAAELGETLAQEGVAVVSGLALGIDAAAHAGALRGAGAAPIGVVGSGLDVAYPRRSAELWQQVAAEGLLLSEYPLGTPPLPWHFLARNRIIAALAEVVVVVESHARGGALATADAAAALGRPVLAVPGPVRSAASSGTNALLADGAELCRSGDDVLVALGLHTAASSAVPGGDRPMPAAAETGSDEALLLEACGWQPATFEQLVLRSSLPASRAAVALEQLIDAGAVEERGGWLERRCR